MSKFIMSVLDKMPNGKSEVVYIVNVERDVDGTIHTFQIGDRQNAVGFQNRSDAKTISDMVMDFEFDPEQPTFVGVQVIEL